MDVSSLVFIGTKTCVAAISKIDGQTVWKTELEGGFAGFEFVTVCCDGEQVYAHTKGQLYCLNALTGELLWFNKLTGMGYQLGSLCVAGQPLTSVSPAMQTLQHQRQVAASAPPP